MLLSGALALTACGGDDTGETADTEIVSTSETPEFKEKDVDQKTIEQNIGEPVEDEGLGVEWTYQGVYPSDVSGAVVTFLVENHNDVPLPPDAIGEPKLEIANGNGKYTTVDQVDADPDDDPSAMPPGLDKPLGVDAATNIQYRFDTAASTLWKARLSIGNVTWEGNLNL